MNDTFECLNCHTSISNNPTGTKHRNHCPFCLWSKHLDKLIPGDRRSSCNGGMEPVALSFKDIKVDPYTNKFSAELMIVHSCLKCGQISSNRVSGDDDPLKIISLLEKTNPNQEVLNKINNLGIKLLTKEDKDKVQRVLYGDNHIY